VKICRFYHPDHGARLGQMLDEKVYDLTASKKGALSTLASTLQASVATPIPELLGDLDLSQLPTFSYADLDRAPDPDSPHLLPPVDRQEIWAAGVTYIMSREARVEETQTKDVYMKVYEAERPELFFKCLGEKAVGPNDWIGIRGDSHWNAPEPELTLVLNPALEIVGYTIGNDVSSRDIEGANPLYLPQAKIYRHSCALGPAITLASDRVDARDLGIEMTIERGGDSRFSGRTSTSKINRALGELAAYLGRYNDFPNGVLLMTGTGIVPPDDFTLEHGDRVLIRIEALGVLRNTARQL
jgi:2-dehydro-3-deoxy-D-arabinonate dehydratase